MKLIHFILLVFSLSVVAVCPAFAQTSSFQSTIDDTVIIKTNGHTLLNGQKNSHIKLDILPDKYVWRYKVIDQPPQPLGSVRVTVQLPPTVSAEAVKPTVYAVHGVESYQSTVASPSTLVFSANNLSQEASLTLTIDLPLSAIQLSFFDRTLASAERLPTRVWLLIAIVIPSLLLLPGLALLVARWRDITLQPTNQPQVSPPANLPPAMVGVLVSGSVGLREIAATLIDLARRGYIDIIYHADGTFGFSQKRQWQSDRQLQPFERYFLTEIFNQTPVSTAKEINQKLNRSLWSETVSLAIDSIYQDMSRLGYFATDPRQVHVTIRFIGIVVFFVAVLGLAASLFFFNQQPWTALPWLVAMIVSPLIIRLALLVPRRTAAGRDQAARWLAFQRWLAEPNAVAYRDQAQVYEQFLAYAVVLSVERPWTARFSGLAAKLPDWFYAQGVVIDSYPRLATTLFAIIGFVGSKFSFSRKPTAA